MSKIPMDENKVRMDPDLSKALEAELAPFEGNDLARAQAAVLKVRQSEFVGPFRALVAHYRDAIQEAVTAP